MGPYVHAYSKLAAVEGVQLDEDGHLQDGGQDRYFHAVGGVVDWIEEEWPGRTQGLVDDGVYSFADRIRFCFGRHVNYLRFRDKLATLAGYESAEAFWLRPDTHGAPFAEIVDFPDHEGILGPVTCRKLAGDFADHQRRAEARLAGRFSDGCFT